MNTIQRTILVATAGLLIVMLLFPPFEAKVGGKTENLGYSFILEPPRISHWLKLDHLPTAIEKIHPHFCRSKSAFCGEGAHPNTY